MALPRHVTRVIFAHDSCHFRICLRSPHFMSVATVGKAAQVPIFAMAPQSWRILRRREADPRDFEYSQTWRRNDESTI
jgi:hypothetical protein